MFDRDLIENVPAEQREAVIKAFLTLRLSGILHAQKQRLLEQLASGHVTEPSADLMKRIRLHRLDRAKLEAFQSLCDQLHEEYSDA